MNRKIEVYSLADWDSYQPWDDLVSNKKGSIYITIISISNLLSDLKFEYENNFDDNRENFLEDTLHTLESGAIHVTDSPYDSELLHDIYIPEEEVTVDLINYHLNVFNNTHPKLPDFVFIDKTPEFWKDMSKEIEEEMEKVEKEGLDDYVE
ncbi:MAG: hypothetical protein ACOC1X_04745, partial [Promethearchaeota archaeon]